MPLYDFECRSCGETQEIYKSLAEIDDAFHCNKRMKRLVSMRAKATFYGYYSEALDTYLPNAKAKRKRMDEVGAAQL